MRLVPDLQHETLGTSDLAPLVLELAVLTAATHAQDRAQCAVVLVRARVWGAWAALQADGRHAPVAVSCLSSAPPRASCLWLLCWRASARHTS